MVTVERKPMEINVKAPLSKMREKIQGLKERYASALAMARYCTVMVPMLLIEAGATANNADLSSRVKTIFNEIYKWIAGITSVSAGCVAAICLFLLFFSKNQQTVEQSISWLKRIVVCWAAIMLMSTIIKFITNNLGLDGSNVTLT